MGPRGGDATRGDVPDVGARLEDRDGESEVGGFEGEKGSRDGALVGGCEGASVGGRLGGRESVGEGDGAYLRGGFARNR